MPQPAQIKVEMQNAIAASNCVSQGPDRPGLSGIVRM
jgi:hypothetical protein